MKYYNAFLKRYLPSLTHCPFGILSIAEQHCSFLFLRNCSAFNGKGTETVMLLPVFLKRCLLPGCVMMSYKEISREQLLKGQWTSSQLMIAFLLLNVRAGAGWNIILQLHGGFYLVFMPPLSSCYAFSFKDGMVLKRHVRYPEEPFLKRCNDVSVPFTCSISRGQTRTSRDEDRNRKEQL